MLSRCPPALFVLFTILLLWGESVFAQTTPIDTARLTTLYETALSRPDDTYIQSRIEEERARIRAAINQSLTTTVAQMDKGAEGHDSEAGYRHQENIVHFLEQERQEAQVDFSLLQDEEKIFYLNPDAAVATTDTYRLTQSHADLLAQKAVEEERMTALESLLPLQKDRLQKLHVQQWLERFSLFIRIAGFVGMLFAIIVLERFFRGLLVRRFRQPHHRYLFTKVFPSVVYAIITVWILSIVFSRYPGVLTSIGIVGAGIVVALQDIVKDVVGWLVIVQRRPFTLGHRIAIGPYTGDVIDIAVLRTTLLEVSHPESERTGKVLFVPNFLLLTQPVLNYHTTSDYLKTEMQVTIAYDADWRKAEGLLSRLIAEETASYVEEAQKQHQRRMWIYPAAKEPTASMVYVEAGAGGIAFTLRFLTPIGDRRLVISKITRRILEEFAKENLALATAPRPLPKAGA